MAILSVNAGSSSLKFSIHRFHDHAVDSAWVSGCLQGLEPGGQPSLSWTLGGQAHEEVLPVDAGDGFARAFGRLRDWLRELAQEFHSYYNAHKVLVDDARERNARLALSEAVRRVIEDGLDVFGIVITHFDDL